jgi:hypothetical protein
VRGGEALDVRDAAGATLDGRTVRIDHGAFVEEYELTADALEQRYVCEALPSAGDLVLRLEVESELAGSDQGLALRFANQHGRVDYGEAFALDATGARVPLDSRLVDGAIELRVPASFADEAALPLVIDPLVTFYTVGGSSHQELYPDVAYDVTTDRWCFTWTDVWSATDHDVFARLSTGSFQLLGTLTIDFTSESWTTPKVANNNGHDVFLIACAVDPSWSTHWSIHGRMVIPSNASTGAPFQISPADATDRYWPDIGGDPYPGVGSSYFCVVWQRVVSGTNVDIEAQLVRPDSTLNGAVIPLENGSGWHEHPYISNSNGIDVGDATVAWTVTWQYRYSPSDHDIYAAQIYWTGAVTQPMFPVQTSSWDETEPMASMLLNSTSNGAPRQYLITWERDYGTDHDVFASVMQTSTVITHVNLVGGFDSSVWYYDQRIPTVDCDGTKFMVGFVERTTPSAYDANIWMCGYYFGGGQLVPCELRSNLAGSPQMETDLALHSAAASGAASKRYAVAWVFESLNNGLDVVGGLWNGCSGGLVTSGCAGDGTGNPCPCGNNGATGRGCANSANSSGALLTASGEASVSADTLVLNASGMPATVTCLFFETASFNALGTALGDGKRCATGFALRMPLKQASGGSASYPQAGDPSISNFTNIPVAGATRYYQAWYRDPAAFCTSATFNLTNSLKVTWAP